jgi:hypothetical protein
MPRAHARLSVVGFLLFLSALFSSCVQYQNAQAMMKAVKANDADKVFALTARDATLVNVPLQIGRSGAYSLTSDERSAGTA